MKVEFESSINEVFTSYLNLAGHYKKRQNNGDYLDLSIEEYEKRAEDLQKSEIDHRKILGYISITREGRNAYCKYNKETGDFVVYTYRGKTPVTITMYRKSWREYISNKYTEYFDEIPGGL